MRLKIIVLLFLVFGAGVVSAASFDCALASTSVEKLICADAELSKLDDELSVSYSKMLKKAGAEEVLKAQQRGWLMNTRNQCESAECLQNSYLQRVKQLSVMSELPLSSMAAGKSPDAVGCKLIAEFASRRALNLLDSRFLAKPQSKQPLAKIFEEDGNFFESMGYWTVDLNNDGVRDHLAITLAGTMRIATVFARSGKPGAKPSKLSGGMDGDFNQDISFLSLGGRYYFLGDDQVWRMGKDGVFEVPCRILESSSQMMLVKGGGAPICALAEKDTLATVSFGLDHQITQTPLSGIWWSKYPLPGMARVDLDNDGQLDNVIQLDFNSSAGRGCQNIVVAVANESATSLPESELNRLLMERIAGAVCGPSMEVVSYAGATYIDAKSSDTRQLYRIRKGKAEAVCEFETRKTFEAMTD